MRDGSLRASLSHCLVAAARGAHPNDVPEPLWETGTFSILGFDPATGEVGGAVQSRVFSVGNGVLWADASVGVAATQAIVDVSYGPQALELLRRGLSPEAIVKQILGGGSGSAAGPLDEAGTPVRRDESEGRIRGVHRPEGDRVGRTQERQVRHRAGQHPRGTRGGEPHGGGVREHPGHLSQRLVAALEGGQAAGGDKRGQQSAAMVIVKKNCGVWLHNDTILRLQVDDNAEPIKELNRLVDAWNTRKPRSVSPECQ